MGEELQSLADQCWALEECRQVNAGQGLSLGHQLPGCQWLAGTTCGSCHYTTPQHGEALKVLVEHLCANCLEDHIHPPSPRQVQNTLGPLGRVVRNCIICSKAAHECTPPLSAGRTKNRPRSQGFGDPDSQASDTAGGSMDQYVFANLQMENSLRWRICLSVPLRAPARVLADRRTRALRAPRSYGTESLSYL